VRLAQRRIVKLGRQLVLVDETVEAGLEAVLVARKAQPTVVWSRLASVCSMYSLMATWRCKEWSSAR
jgi:hypothetical protein